MFDFLYTNKWESNEWFANQEYETIGSGLLFVEFIESDLIDWTVIYMTVKDYYDLCLTSHIISDMISKLFVSLKVA